MATLVVVLVVVLVVGLVVAAMGGGKASLLGLGWGIPFAMAWGYTVASIVNKIIEGLG